MSKDNKNRIDLPTYVELFNITQFQILETNKMLEIMNADLFKIMKKTDQESEDQCWRRMVVRTALSIVESVCFRMKLLAINVGILKGIEFSKREKAFLYEEKEIKRKDDSIEKRKFYPESKENLKFVFKIIARMFGTKFEIKEEDVGWRSYVKAIEIRNRITHPKNIEDLNVSIKDYDTAGEAFRWFSLLFNELLKEIKKFENINKSSL